MASPAQPYARFVTPLAIVVVVVALWLGRDLLIPLALSVLFTFLLEPLVSRVERWHVGRLPAVLLVTSFCAAGIGTLGYVVALQGIELSEQLPQYRDNIQAKLRALTPDRDNPIAKAAETLRDIGEEIAEPPASEAVPSSEAPRADLPQAPSEPRGQAAGDPPDEPPVPVQVVPPRQSPLRFVAESTGPLLGPLSNAGIVLVLVIFLLLRREDVRDRLIHLTARGEMHVTTQALSDASARVSRYLLMQLVVNTIYAVPVAIGLMLIGVPSALLWALLGLLLRFIPYVGPAIAAGMPILLSLAVFDDWTLPLLVIGLYVVTELVINNLVEPWLYGSSTGMSSVAVIVSAMFWTWLWGPVGLFMATPLTATLVAFGKHVPRLSFLDVLLGDEPVGTPGSRFYQRLVAMDQDEAADIAETERAARGSLVEVYDAVLVPALHAAERDRHDGHVDEERSSFIRASVAEIAEELLEAEPAPTALAAAPDKRVLCVPARDAADQLVAKLLADVLEAQGHAAVSGTTDSLVSEHLEAIERINPHVVCISALPPSATAHVRYLYKRLRARFPDLPIVVGLWQSQRPQAQTRARIGCASGDAVVTTLDEATEEVRRLMSRPAILPARRAAPS